ncbi:MAG: efflux RND transporter permease subunit [Polyangia bacterium]
MSLVGAARSRAVAIYLVIALLAAAGVYEATTLPAGIFPSVTFPLIKVIASVGDEPAARMMPTVTRPLEEAILRVPGVESVRSTTSRGSVEIAALFGWGVDMEVARQRVQSETQRVLPDLPPETRIDVEWMNTSVFPIEGYALTSDTLSQAELRTLAEYTLKPALYRIPGVSQVQIQGGRNREFEVHLDQQAMQGRKLSAADVVSAIQKNDMVQSAGLVERNHELYLTLVDGRVHTLAELTALALPAQPGDAPVRLGDLGKIEVSDEISYVRTTANNKPAVLINLIRQPQASTITIADGVRKLLRDHAELLPKGVEWSVFYDQARFVSGSIAGARDAIVIGIGLAALVLLVFLRSLRLTVIAVVAILLCIAVVGLGLAALGQTLNLMTLAGVAAALGLIADDAIVVIENIHAHREAGQPNPAASGTRELLPALIGSSLSTTVIFLPFALLTGVTGAFFKPLALTMALALTVSFLLALFAVPTSVALFGPKPDAAPTDPGRLRAWLSARMRPLARLWDHASHGYGRAARFTVAHGSIAVAGIVLLLVASRFLYTRMQTDFLPHMDEGAIILDYYTPPGTSLSDTNAMLDEAEKVISATPDVAGYSRRTGTQLGFFITEPNRGDYVINLKPRAQRRAVDEVIDDLRRKLAATEPGIHTDFGQLLEDSIGDLTGGTPQPIEIKIFGASQTELEAKARAAALILSKVPGVEDVFDGVVIAGPALDIRVDSTAAGRYGLTTSDVRAAVVPALVGNVVDHVRVGERLYPLRVFSGDRAADLTTLPIRTPSGALVPLGNVAQVTTGKPESEIDRKNLKTFIGVTARLSGRSLGQAVADIRQHLEHELPLASGMTLEYGGLYAQQQASFRNLLYVLVVGLLLLSVVVLFEFGDWRAPLVTALCALAVLSGVFLLLMITGQTLNISSYVGAIMIVGIAGENAIFVIHEARLGLAAGKTPQEAWSDAAVRRARPVAMTILATTCALAPIAMAIGQGSQLMQPLAIAVIGGFALSGPVVLLLVPGLYHLMDPRGRLGPNRP